MIKTLNKLHIKGTYLKILTAECEKLTASIIMSREEVNVFL
jgi:hypothetical protein